MATRVGILHPGEMGASVGAAARAGGAEVCWAGAGRSAATATRAAHDGLHDAGTVADLVAEVDVLVSVCPPAAAVDVAAEVADLAFGGVYVDANAVAPGTARRVAEIVSLGGADAVDGGIVGPPARRAGTTRLYLSGTAAPVVADLFAGSALEAVVLAGGPGAASALKAAYAAWTKGTSALLLAVRALAAAEDVDEALLAEWAVSQPGLAERSEGATATARKAWRFVGEMDEIAGAFADAGLPSGFHAAAADVYRRMEAWKDAPSPPALADVVATLTGARRTPAAATVDGRAVGHEG